MSSLLKPLIQLVLVACIGFGLGGCVTTRVPVATSSPWQVVDLNTDANPLDVAFTSADHGFLVGSNRLILETNDGGSSWNERSLDLPDEENFRLLRVMAAHQAGRVACGTYAVDLADLWPSLPPYVHLLLADGAEPPDNLFDFFHLFPQPKQVEALFLHIESKRVAAQLTASYRGLREDLAWAEEQTQLYPAALSMLLPRLPRRCGPT